MLGISIARDGAESYLRQLYNHLRDLVLSGQLAPGERLPSTRVLADEIQVSRNTVMVVYEQLQSEGYVSSVVGSGTRIALTLPEGLLQARADVGAVREMLPTEVSQRCQKLATLESSVATWLPTFSPGMPAIDQFPFPLWSKFLADEWKTPSLGALPNDPGGYWPLREHIASYVRGARGVSCEADQVIIVSGNREGTELAARVLLDVGDTAIVENPGYAGVRSALVAAGIELLPLEVDAEGMVVSELSERHRNAKMLCVAPSHHYPLGGMTSLARRLAILDWCRTQSCWILEDDYDSEFRYSERPLPSLQSLDPAANLIYVGTFSKTLFPSLRIGYVIVPKPLIKPFVQMKMAASGPTAVLAQRAIARFMDNDLFYRHVRTMRKLYQGRRVALLKAIQTSLPSLRIPAQQDAGLFLLTEIVEGSCCVSDTEIARQARAIGIHLEPLSASYIGDRRRQGLIFGFGAISEDAIAGPVKRLASLLRSLDDRKFEESPDLPPGMPFPSAASALLY